MQIPIDKPTYTFFYSFFVEKSEDDLTWLSASQCAIGNGGAMILMLCLGIQDASHSKQHIEIEYVQYCFWVSAAWFLVLAVPLYVFYTEEPPRDALKPRNSSFGGTPLSTKLIHAHARTHARTRARTHTHKGGALQPRNSSLGLASHIYIDIDIDLRGLKAPPLV